jgi:DNA-binding transcriptional MerR regulator
VNPSASVAGLLRIGELSRRTGVTPDRLRAWEQRYGLLRPDRTPGGFRLYSPDDERRVVNMLARLADGLSAAQAARVALAAVPPADTSAPLDDSRRQLADALATLDDLAADAILDRLLAAHGPELTMQRVIYPYLRELGEAWERAELHVGQEHFASNLLQRRLMALARGWDGGFGIARALLACPPGEHHVLGLIGLGVALRNAGWRVTYLGADTPVDMTARAAATVQPEIIVLAATMPHCLPRVESDLRSLAADHHVALAGPAAGAAITQRVGARHLTSDPVTAGAQLTGR